MEESRLIEKIFNLLAMLKSPFMLVVILVMLLISSIILINATSKDKKNIILSIVSVILMPIILFILYNQTFLNLLDKGMHYIVKSIYFPDMGLYIITVILANIIIIKKLKRSKPDIKLFVNVIFYNMITILFALMLINLKGIVIDNNIYLNKNIKTILEINAFLNIVWYGLILINNMVHKDQKETIKVIYKEKIKENNNQKVKRSEPFTKEEYILILDLLKDYYDKQNKNQL